MLSTYIKDHTRSNDPPSDVRLCVCGAFDVGKSAVTVRFLTRRFISEYQRNVQLSYGGAIQFGPDVINFELKDMTPSTDMNFFTTWPNCLAIVYSIIDRTSFDIASKILNHVDSTLRQTLGYTSRSLSLALIANKNDLTHYRRVNEEDGRNLAFKYGASFWEVSASDDYNSVFRPLHSLIVETFLSNYSLWRPSGTSDQTSAKPDPWSKEDDSSFKQRPFESPTPVPKNPYRKITPTLSISPVEEAMIPEISDRESKINSSINAYGHSQHPFINQHQQKENHDAIGSKSTPLLNGMSSLKHKRSLFKQRKSFSLDSKDNTDTFVHPGHKPGLCSASASSTPPSTPPSGENTPSGSSTIVLPTMVPSFKSGSSITINVQGDEEKGDLLTPTRYIGGLSKSFSKADRKQRPPRLQSTKSFDKTERYPLQQPTVIQSQSCTDLNLQAGMQASSQRSTRDNSRTPENTRRDRSRKSSNSDQSRSTNSSPTSISQQFKKTDQDGEVSESWKRKSVKKKISSMLRAFSNTNIDLE